MGFICNQFESVPSAKCQLLSECIFPNTHTREGCYFERFEFYKLSALTN